MRKYSKLYAVGSGLYVLGITLGFLCASEPCHAQPTPTQTNERKEQKKMMTFGHIDAKALKNMIETKMPISIVDARNEEWDDGRRIPTAKSLPFDSSPDKLAQVLPEKDVLVAVYCGASVCPLGKKLVQNLLSQGYTHILEYEGGMKEWADEFHYPVEIDETVKLKKSS